MPGKVFERSRGAAEKAACVARAAIGRNRERDAEVAAVNDGKASGKDLIRALDLLVNALFAAILG